MRALSILTLITLATGAAPAAAAQNPKPQTFGVYQVDFAVPDAPAFLLLSIEPSTILRPQSVRELATNLGGFRNADGSLALPRAAAIEFSPSLLFTDGRPTVASYSAARLLYNTRISLATQRDSTTGAATKFAFGVRLTLANEADFKTDAAYDSSLQVQDITKAILDVYNAARNRVGPSAPLALNADERSTVDSLEKEVRARWAVRYWNADILDVAFAFAGMAADSTGRDPQLGAVSVWASYAKGMGSWGQAMVGFRTGWRRGAPGAAYNQSATLALRLYAGSNRGKAFAEIQQDFQENTSAVFLLNSGIEFRLAGGVWAIGTLGISQPGGTTPRTVASLKINTTLLGL